MAMNYSLEQATHDEVNLLRLVRRLEKSVAVETDWDDAAVARKEDVWLQALGTLQVFFSIQILFLEPNLAKTCLS